MIIEVDPQIQIGEGQPLALIAGPCVIESEEHVHFLVTEIRKIAGPFVFKASFGLGDFELILGFAALDILRKKEG